MAACRRVKKTEGTRATYAFNEYYEEETTEAGEPAACLLWTYSGDALVVSGSVPVETGR